jgi:hypothetical protein
MKKRFLLYFLISISLIFNGCSNPKYINLSKKPSACYYSESLYTIIKKDEFNVSVIDSNFYKQLTLNDEDKLVINNFFSSLTTNCFIKKPDTITEKPLYKLFLVCKNQKYVIDIFTSDLISISPWDGSYEPDFISMNQVPQKFNLLNFCKYIYNK